MSTNSTFDKVSDGNKEHGIGNWGKTDPYMKWLESVKEFGQIMF